MRNNREKLTQEYLKECLSYNPLTGIFIWNVRPLSHFKNYRDQNIWNTRYSNKEVGCIDNRGYPCSSILNKSYRLHRLAFLYMEGYFPEHQVDHIDRDKSNNKWNNLREVTNQCNHQNCDIQTNNTSGVCGVFWCKRDKKWLSRIKISQKNISLGWFDNFEDAVKARYREEVDNPLWTCSVESSAYKYLKERNLI